jgi:integrase
MDSQNDHIIKQGTRILTPSEYEALRAIAMKNTPRYAYLMDAMLHTGMRPVEFERMERSWYRPARRCIELPKGACLKEKCQYKERTIHLSLPGCDALDNYFNRGIVKPKKVSLRDTLRRYAKEAGIGEDGITSKMFRKTLDSWLIACYEDKYPSIASSMGHDIDTILKHYLGIAFPPGEIDKMKVYLNEWGRKL